MEEVIDNIEILDAFKKGENFFVKIAKNFKGSRYVYQFGVSKAGYNTIKRVFHFRPFNSLSTSDYKYFLNSCGGNGSGFEINVRFEQDNNSKVYSIKSEQKLMQNMLWFMNEVKSTIEIEHLRVET